MRIFKDIPKNKRLLSKEDSIRHFIQNNIECVGVQTNEYTREVITEKNGFRTKTEERENVNKDYFIPENLVEVAHKIFANDNVYVALTPYEYYFNKEGVFVTELPTNTQRSLDPNEILKSVDNYLKKGAIIYMYTYYKMKQGIVGMDGPQNTYWWRMITKLE